jgi:phosphate-selective porin OprO and OprP
MPSRKYPLIAKSLIWSAALGLAGALHAADPSADEIAQLRTQIRALEARLDALESSQRPAATAPTSASAPEAVPGATAPAAAQAAPRITIDDTGFTFASGTGETYIRLHGLVQGDGRFFEGGSSIANNDTFVLRRARLIFEGAFDKSFSFLILPEFGGGGTGTSNAPVLYDANVGIALTPEVKLVAGKFKSPVGLELLQNDAALLFNERSLATNLVASRDVGFLLSGAHGGLVSYAAGIVDGSADAGYTNNTDTDNNKDFVGRVFLTPWAASKDSPLAGLGFGIGASAGQQNKTGQLTSGYKTDGQQTFFTYRSTVQPYGTDWRLSPQANFYQGSFSAQAEYVASTVTVLSGASKKELTNKGWQLAAGYVLTGEKVSYNGYTPQHVFNPSEGSWGAWEIGVRVADLKIDSAAFPTFADPAASASEATSYGVSLNGFLSKAIRVSLDLVDTQFDRAPGWKTTSNLLIGQDERALLTRFQVGF